VTEAAFAALAVASIAAVVGAGLGFAIGTTGTEEKWSKAKNRAAC
jgi:membrane protein DedA with SNARE-associated domain